MRMQKMFFLMSVFMRCCLANSNTQESVVRAVTAVTEERIIPAAHTGQVVHCKWAISCTVNFGHLLARRWWIIVHVHVYRINYYYTSSLEEQGRVQVHSPCAPSRPGNGRRLVGH